MVLLHIAMLAAQAVPPEPPRLDEIIVTGERRERRLQDTAASVAVFTDEDLRGLAAADRLESLLALVPNVQLGSGGEAPTIRGQDSTGVIRDLPAFLGGTRPRTTLQIDGRPADYFELVFGLASLWDVDRIEAFRSPQTITQGRNAIAGAIFIETADPTFDWSARARAIGSASGHRQLSAAVGGPAVGDDIAFRLSADWGRDRPSSDIVDSMIGASPDIDKQSLIRLKFLARPTAELRIETGISHSHSQMPQFEGIRAPFKQRRDPLATYGVFGSWIDALTSEIGFDLSPSFTSTTTLTASKSRFRRYAPQGLGQALVKKRLLTGEQLVRWTASDRLSLLGGVHLLDERIDQYIDISLLKGVGEFDDRQGSLGMFGEVEWKATPTWTLAGALRYQRDTQDRGGAIVGVGPPATLDYAGRFHAWMPRLSLRWSPTARLTLGALTQKAYNPGGSTLLLNGVTDSFDAETLWDHELFARGTMRNRALRWSVNLFLQQFRDAQRPQSEEIEVAGGPPVTITSLDNAPRARSYGAEAEIDWQANSRLRLKGGLGLLSTRITKTLDPADPLHGREFQRAPHISASVAIEWKPIEPLTLSSQVRGHGDYFSDDSNSPARRIGAGMIADAKATYDFGPAKLSAYVRNLANRFQLTYLLSATWATAADPREFGIELDANF